VEEIISSLPTSSPAFFSTRFRAMQHRNFQLFIAGQLISLIGTWMQNTAQLWLVYRLTGSAALLGIFGFASQVPMLFLSSLGGYLGDHYNRHRGVIATQTVSMVLAFVLSALTLTGRIQGWHGAWVVVAIAFGKSSFPTISTKNACRIGTSNAFTIPTRNVIAISDHFPM